MERITCPLILALVIASCTGPSMEPSRPASIDDALDLGHVVDGKLNLIRKDKCVKGDVRLEGASSSKLEYLYAQDYQDLLALSEGSGKSKVKHLGPSAEARAAFYSRIAETDLSTSIIFKYEYIRGAAKLWNKSPLRSDLSSMSAGELYKACGDRYVDQVIVGARIFLAMNLGFESKEAKEKLKLKAKFKAFGHSKTLKKTIQESSDFKDASLSISAFQEGGDPSGLELILAKFTGTRTGKAVCKLENLETVQKCLDLQAEIIAYAKKDFAQQLAKSVELAQIRRLAVFKIIAKDYRSGGLPTLWKNPSSKGDSL